MTRRNNPLRDYPQRGHKLSRLARPSQVVRWIQRHVEAEGGSATFFGFGPTALRLFGKAQALLGSDYHTQLIVHDAQPGRVGKVTWPQVKEEYRLMVRRDSPGQPGGSSGIGRAYPSDPGGATSHP